MCHYLYSESIWKILSISLFYIYEMFRTSILFFYLHFTWLCGLWKTQISLKQDSKESSPRSLDKMLLQLQVNSQNVQNWFYFFTCILPDYVAHDITKEFWKNSNFENMRAVFVLRCQNTLRWGKSLICH